MLTTEKKSVSKNDKKIIKETIESLCGLYQEIFDFHKLTSDTYLSITDFLRIIIINYGIDAPLDGFQGTIWSNSYNKCTKFLRAHFQEK